MRRARQLSTATVLSLVLLGAFMFAPLREAKWTAQASEMVVVSGSAAPIDNAYQYDVITRRFVMATYTAIIGAPRFETEAARELGLAASDRRTTEVKVHASPTSAVITASAGARQAWVAEGMAKLTLDRGRHYIGSLHTLFVVEPVATTPARRVEKLRPLPLTTLFAMASVLTWAACRWPPRAKGSPSKDELM